MASTCRRSSWESDARGRLRFTGALRYGGAGYRTTPPRLRRMTAPSVNALTGRRIRLAVVGRSIRWSCTELTYSRASAPASMTDLGTLGIQGSG